MKKLFFAFAALILTAFVAAPAARADDHHGYRHGSRYRHYDRGGGGYYRHHGYPGGYRGRYRHYGYRHGHRYYYYDDEPVIIAPPIGVSIGL